MRIIVFSDIHGNVQALEAMLQQAKMLGVEQFIFCGDIMGYFLGQEEVLQYLRQLEGLYAVLGNHDSYYIRTAAGSKERVALAKKYGQSYLKELGSKDQEYLNSLPLTVKLHLGSRSIFAAHGSMEQYLEGRIYPDTEVDAVLYGRYDIVILGHTHYRMCRKIGHTILLNPGSLGQPRDGKGYSYCLADLEKNKFWFQQAAVNQNKLLEGLDAAKEDWHLINYLKSKMEGVT